jgi:single-stranded DNA-binding protein
MQSMGITGKIYNMKDSSKGEKKTVMFNVSVRKQFVTDADKEANRTNTFVPCVARGKTAEIILQNYKDGDIISIGDMEYQTWKSSQDVKFDDRHIFNASRISYFPLNGTSDSNGEGQPARSTPDRRPSNGRTAAAPARSRAQQTVPDYEVSADDLPF